MMQAWRQRTEISTPAARASSPRFARDGRFDYQLPAVSKILVRNIALFGGMLVAGLICARAVPFMTSLRGVHGPGILTAGRPALAAVVVLACFAVTTLLACVVGKLSNAAVGLFVLGAGVFVLDDRLGGIRELAFAHASRGTLVIAAIETIVLAVVALAMVLIVFGTAGGFHDVEPDVNGRRPHWLTSDAALRSAACGVLVIPAVWLVAQTPLKGQAITAVFFGAMLAGLVGRLIAPHVQPILVFVSPVIFGALAQLAAAVLTRMPLDEAYVNGSLSVLARVLPMDYLAGALLGVSFGLGWAKSFLQHEETPAPANA
jgi:hypothetical protein